MKFENLEEMSKCPGLNKQTKNLSKFEEKKKIIVRFSGKRGGKKQ